MAISTYKAFLMHKGSGVSDEWEKLVDIKDFPDLGGAPETLDTTTLSDKMRTSINGIQELDSLTFTCNYDDEKFDDIYALRGTNEHYAVWLGGTESGSTLTPTGSDGKFEFDGQLSVFVNGGGVNEVVNMTITIAASTPITKAS